MKTIPCLVIAALLLSGSAGIADDQSTGATPPTEFQAITAPSQDVTLSFTKPGRVSDMLVKLGDHVTAQQMVAKEDDTEEAAALAVAQAQADDNTRYEAQLAVSQEKQQIYDDKVKSHVASNAELIEAELDVKVGAANVKLSEAEHHQDALKALQAKAALDKTRLYTPIAGNVEQTMVKAGESVDAQSMKVMRIVNTDPLWIDVPVAFSLARTLKDTDPATIIFSNKEVRVGKVINVASVADAGSDTLLVRVEVQNTAKTPAGERVKVSFADAKVAATN